MKNCNNKISNTCGSTTYATCSIFEGTPNSQSELAEVECLNQEEVTQDIYNQIGEIKDSTDLTALGELCLTYTLEEGEIIVKNVLAKFEEIICDLQNKIELLETESLCTKSIAACNFEWGDLVNSCGDTPQTFFDAIQTLINKVNE